MHLLNALIIAQNSNTGWLHNIIVNVFFVVLKDAMVLPTYALSILEQNLLIEVNARFHSQVVIPVVSKSVTLFLSP